MPDTRYFNLFLDIITIAPTCSKLPKIFLATLNHAHQIKCDLLSCYLMSCAARFPKRAVPLCQFKSRAGHGFWVSDCNASLLESSRPRKDLPTESPSVTYYSKSYSPKKPRFLGILWIKKQNTKMSRANLTKTLNMKLDELHLQCKFKFNLQKMRGER